MGSCGGVKGAGQLMCVTIPALMSFLMSCWHVVFYGELMCFLPSYKDYRSDGDYSFTPQFWLILAVRFAFVILFEVSQKQEMQPRLYLAIEQA
jgi:hypothetical protein